MQHRFRQRMLALLMLAVMMLTALPATALSAHAQEQERAQGTVVIQEGSQAYSLFNSGATQSSGRYYSSSSGADYNPDSHSYDNYGYDIYGDSGSYYDLTLGLGLSFFVSAEVKERASLTIYAYDIDEESNQIDDIYLVNEATGQRTHLGHLSGRDETWSTTTLFIDPSYFVKGETYHFEVDVCKGGWWTWVRRVSLEMTVGDYVPTVILDHSFSASISANAQVATTLYLATNETVNYQLEYTASIRSEQKGGGEGEIVTATPSGVTVPYHFYLESGAPVGSYEITVIVKDMLGNTVASYSATAGYEYSAVSYHPNGGSNNLPTDPNAYLAGDQVEVLFDYLPSRSGYTFLGWARNADALVADYRQGGVTSFVIGDTDVVLYAVWQKNPDAPGGDMDVWNGSVASDFGGGSGTQTDPYLIYTAEQLAYLAYSTNNGNSYADTYFKLMSNLDLGGIPWTPIGKSEYTNEVYSTVLAFSGHFDGNYHVIYALNPSVCSSFTGLFGMVHNGSVKRLGIEASSVEYCGDLDDNRLTAALLAGSSYLAEFSTCYVLGDIDIQTSESVDIGLLVGDYYSSSMVDCYAKGDVNVDAGSLYVGGMFGFNDNGLVKRCYYYGTISGYGAIYGADWGGDDSQADYENLYYHSNFSGRGVGLTEAQMATGSSFSGYDFDSVWVLDGTDSSPRLRYFLTGGAPVACPHSYVGTLVEPTCTEDGYTLFTCSLCGDETTDAIVPRLGHVVGEWVILQEATCTESGRKQSQCTRCLKILEDVYIPPERHDYLTTVEKEATCTEPGVLSHCCIRCSDSYTSYVYSEHSYQISDYRKEDCYVDGRIVYTCEHCADSYEEIIPGGHDYCIEITKVATSTQEGLITYTCYLCGHSYTETIPVRPDATVLLIQDRIPWSSNDNVILLNRLASQGYISGWDIVTTGEFDAASLGAYSVVMIANDQDTAFYNRLATMNEALTSFASAGGVVIYGACDNGWANGSLSHRLPADVEKQGLLSRYNYIVDADHAIVSGALTDGKRLTNDLLYGNYCSHTYFSSASLPADSNVILQNASGNPTLVEYPVGEGYVIASGLTWEFYYNRNSYAGPSATYSKNVFDDLVVYAVYLSNPCDHVYDAGTVVPPTCTEEGYTLHVCESCGREMKDHFVSKIDHVAGDWTTVTEPTATQTGLAVCYCVMCQAALGEKILPIPGGADGKDGSLLISSDVSEVFVGREFDVIFALSSVSEAVGSVDFRVLLPEGLQYVSHQILVSEQDYMLSTYVAEEGLFGCGMSLYGKTGSFQLLKLTLKATEAGVFAVDVSLSALDEGIGNLVGDGKLAVSVGEALIVCATEHTCVFDQEVAEERYRIHEATCTRPACYRKSCICGEVGGIAAFEVGAPLGHLYDHNCDQECNRCLQTRPITHSYKGWESNRKEHWQLCDCCGYTTDKSAHSYADVYSRVCTVCSLEHYGMDGTVTVDTPRTDVYVDRTFDVYFSVNALTQPVGAVDFHVVLTEGLEYVSHEILVSPADFSLSTYVAEEGFFGCGMTMNGKTGSFQVLKLTLKAVEEGDHKIFASLLGNGEGVSDLIGASTLDFICPEALEIRSTFHTCVFDRELAEEAYWISDATCTQAACYYKSCICGEKGEESFFYGAPLGHTHTRWYSDADKHWHVCDVCFTVEDEQTHSYSDFWDADCEVCQTVRTRPLLGDANGDGAISFADIQRIYQHLSTPNKLSGDALIIADANKDQTLNFSDIQRIYQHISTPNKMF